MTVNREQKQDGFSLATAVSILRAPSPPKLTKREQAIQDTKILIAMLRQKREGGTASDQVKPPGVFLKKVGAISHCAHSTVEKNNSQELEDTIVEKNNSPRLEESEEQRSALSEVLKLISSFPKEEAPQEIPVENST